LKQHEASWGGGRGGIIPYCVAGAAVIRIDSFRRWRTRNNGARGAFIDSVRVFGFSATQDVGDARIVRVSIRAAGGVRSCLGAYHECCIGAGIGAALDMPSAADPLRWLFAEDPSRILVTVGQNQVAEALRLAAEYNLVVETIGSTGGDNFTVSLSELTVLEVSVSDLRLSYETALEQAVEKVAEVS